MRITCPNCGAQYEVDARVIPDIGRDVQCSNCGHTWFQRPQSAVAASVRRVVEDPPVTPAEPESDATADQGAAAATRAAQAFPPIADDPDLTGTSDDTRVAETQAPGPEGIADPPVPSRPWAEPVPDPLDDSTGTERDGDAPDASEPQVTEPGTPRDEMERDGTAQLDDQMRAVLREEADREARARAAETRPVVEFQSDLGLQDETGSRPRQRTANLHATEADQDDGGSSAVAAAMAAAANRRENLPDVDSINSSLRSKSASRDDEDDPETEDDVPARSGFRTGFLLALLLVIVALLVYLYAPALADTVPSLRAPLASYVEAINGLRIWVDGLLTGATAQLNSLSG